MISYAEYIKPSQIYLYTLKEGGGNIFYVGKTNNPSYRYNSHISGTQHHSNKIKNKIIQSAISEGREILMNVFWCGNSDEWQERYWIAKFKYDWQIPIVNIHSGGEGVEFTQEIKDKISAKLKGKRLSEATKQKMKGRPIWNKGLKSITTKSVEQVKDGEILNTFNSIREAGQSLGINRGNISLVVNGKRKTIGGFVFRYGIN